MRQLTAIVNGRLITGTDDDFRDGVVLIEGGQISDVVAQVPPGEIDQVDAAGAIVAPGIVDLHGDAFERAVMPRPRVSMPMTIALADTIADLASSGVSTGFISITDSWEPGLRSRETLREFIDQLRRSEPGPDLRVHVRHETTNTHGTAELQGWLRAGDVTMLSLADHAPGGITAPGTQPSAVQCARTGCDAATLAELTDKAIARRSDGQRVDSELARIAAELNCPVASHDSSSADDLQRDLALGVNIAEFPMTGDLAGRYRAEGVAVLFGAPNVVRGGSHSGNVTVSEVIDIEAGDILCSDYHYPSLLHAPFVLADAGLDTLARTWRTVSTHPAAAAGLTDRGVLAPGQRADVVLVDDQSTPCVTRLIVGGNTVHEAVPVCVN